MFLVNENDQHGKGAKYCLIVLDGITKVNVRNRHKHEKSCCSQREGKAKQSFTDMTLAVV